MSNSSTCIIRSYTQHIQAPPERVLPLLCPVRETEWLDGWTFELIHSESGVAEEGCVFRAPSAADMETIWMITRQDFPAGFVEMVRVTAGLVATRLRIRVEADGDGRSIVHITYDFSPTSEAGHRFVEEKHSEEEFREAMAWWERSMNHFLRTGTCLRKG